MAKNSRLDKFAIAAALQEIAALLELKGGKDRFKARAYQTGARVIAGLSEDIGDVVLENRLTSMRGHWRRAGVANRTALSHAASRRFCSGLKTEFPPGIIELSGVPGLSVCKIKALHETLGITSVAELKAAAKPAKSETSKALARKLKQTLLETISDHRQRVRNSEDRLHLHRALQAGEQIVNYLQTSRDAGEVSFAGSLRRWKETVGTDSPGRKHETAGSFDRTLPSLPADC